MTQIRVAAPRRTGVIVSLVVVALIVAGLAWRIIPAFGPWQAARAYCDDLTHQRYAAIYQQHSTAALQTTISLDAFVAAQTLADQQAGTVRSCDVAPLSITATGATATAQITEQRSGGVAIRATLHLAGSAWQLATWPDAAIAPYAIAYRYCQALSQQDYSTAYHLFTTTITGQLNATDYISFAQLADAGSGTVDHCTISHLGLDHTSATAAIQIHRQHGDANGTTTDILLAQQTDQSWQITNLPHA